MKFHYSPSPAETKRLEPEQLRAAFLISDLFQPGQLVTHYTDLDRMIAGGVTPTSAPLPLPNSKQATGTDFFLERREIGIINIGAPGAVRVGGKSYPMGSLDCLYIGKGERDVLFENGSSGQAQYFFISTPAHMTYPTAHAARAQGTQPIGDPAKCNRRRINRYIHANGIKSCQLVMGFTEFEPGSVWNTMPPHTHSRRTEIYLYFDLGTDMVVHLMGEPQATQHLIVRDREAILSPAWSIHAGVGTGAYRFIWAMGGDNQTFEDMDQVAIADLK